MSTTFEELRGVPDKEELHGYTESSSLLGAKSPKASAGQGSALLGGSSGPPASHLLKEASGPVTESRRSFDWYRLGPGVQGISLEDEWPVHNRKLSFELVCFNSKSGSDEHLLFASPTSPRRP